MLGGHPLGAGYLGYTDTGGTGPLPVFFRSVTFLLALLGAQSPETICRSDVRHDARSTQVVIR